MGFAKQRWEEEQERGYPYTNKLICSKCLDDVDLKNLVKNNGKKDKCSFCSKSSRVISFDDILERILESIKEYYEDPNSLGIPWSNDEEGWATSVLEIDELLDELPKISENEQVIDDLKSIFGDRQWCRVNDYYPSDSRDLEYSWETFEETVKHERRFTFHRIRRDDINESLFNSMLKRMTRMFIELNMVKTISKETIFYRARNSDLLISEPSQLGSPPSQKARYSNRMSPEGISMFYGAFDKITCINEIFDKTNMKNGMTIGQFINLEELYLLDFTDLPELPGFFSGIQFTREAIIFLDKFSKKISKPIIKDDLEHIEYIPTQVFTEYIRFDININKRRIDGINYNSSKNNGKCVVLFFENNECISANEKSNGRYLALKSVQYIDIIKEISKSST